MIAALGRFGLFAARFAVASVSRPPPVARTVEHAYRIGVRSLPILLVISAFVGTNLAFQGYHAFRPLGAQGLVGMFVALAGVREMAPIMVAAMVAAKAGTEMASQIAVMRIREQIDALEVMSVNPLWYLVLPRFLGILLVLPGLTIISIFTVVVAGWVVVVFQLGGSGADYLALAWATIRPIDFAYSAMKAFDFGIIICLVSCFFGFTSKPGPQGVGSATNAAVVWASVVCAVLNYFLSELMYG